MRALLLAAGLGSRLRPVTEHRAKPSVPLLNVPLLYWSYDLLQPLGLDALAINLHYLPKTIEALIPRLKRAGAPAIGFSHEVEKPLGSGGGIAQARRLLEAGAADASFVVANADEVILPLKSDLLTRMRAAHEASDALMTILTMPHAEAGKKFGGVWTESAAGGRVFGFGKDRSKVAGAEAATPLHYVGVLMLRNRIFNYFPSGESNIFYDIAVQAMARGERVQAFCEDMIWYETGSPGDFLEATEKLLPLLSPVAAAAAVAGANARRIVSTWGIGSNRYWESNTGAQLLCGDLASGSLPFMDICAKLERERSFAVIGDGALVESAPSGSVVLPGAHVAVGASDSDIFV